MRARGICLRLLQGRLGAIRWRTHLSLQVVGRIPVRVEYDHLVGTGQIEAEPPGTSRNQKPVGTRVSRRWLDSNSRHASYDGAS